MIPGWLLITAIFWLLAMALVVLFMMGAHHDDEDHQ